MAPSSATLAERFRKRRRLRATPPRRASEARYEMSPTVIATAALMGVWLFALINVTPIMLWLERRAPAFMQDRLGPNRLGLLGLFQAIADVLKFIFKEDVNPAGIDRAMFILAPTIGFVSSL